MKLIEIIRNILHGLFCWGTKKGLSKQPQVDDGIGIKDGPNEASSDSDMIEPGFTKEGQSTQQLSEPSQPVNGGKTEISPQFKDYTVQIVPFLTSILKLDYEATYKVQYSISNSADTKYPIIRAPKKGCEIKLPIVGRSGKRGVCEEILCKIIRNLDLQGFYDNLSLFVGNYNKPYEPDIVYIDAQKGIFVDIEIDEPYSGWERRPIHYKTGNGTIDDLRNLYFTKRGWTVIRFSEKQVYEFPRSCVKRVYQLLNQMDTTITMPHCLATEVDISSEDMWTKKQAERMEQNKKREKMLGISKFIQSVEKPHTTLKDYLKGKELEKKISIKQNEQPKDIPPAILRYSSPKSPVAPITSPNDERLGKAEQYEHQQHISTQSKSNPTPSSRGYA